jgi:hypothetical protein
VCRYAALLPFLLTLLLLLLVMLIDTPCTFLSGEGKTLRPLDARAEYTEFLRTIDALFMVFL